MILPFQIIQEVISQSRLDYKTASPRDLGFGGKRTEAEARAAVLLAWAVRGITAGLGWPGPAQPSRRGRRPTCGGPLSPAPLPSSARRDQTVGGSRVRHPGWSRWGGTQGRGLVRKRSVCVYARVCALRVCMLRACIRSTRVRAMPCRPRRVRPCCGGRGAPSASPGEGGRALQDARITSVPPDFPPSLEWDARSGRGPAGTAHLCGETDAPVAAGPGERLDCTVRGPRSRWRRGGRDARLSRGPNLAAPRAGEGGLCVPDKPRRSPQSWPQCGEPGQAGRGGGGGERVPAGSPRPRPRTGHRPSHLSPARLPPFCPRPPARPCPCSCLSTKPRAGPVPAGSHAEGGLWDGADSSRMPLSARAGFPEREPWAEGS